MIRKILWGPTLFTAIAVVAWTAGVGQDAAHAAILPTLIVSSVPWFWFVARRSRPGAVRGVVVGAIIGLASQMLVAVLWKLGSSVVVGAWSTLLGGLMGWLSVMIQRVLDDPGSTEGR
jgi:hypothetical protein